jgi:hypothetical protein
LICIAFFRGTRGRERILVAGWLPGTLLGPLKNLFSTSAADAIQFFEVMGITVALVESVLIFREYSGRNGVSNRRMALKRPYWTNRRRRQTDKTLGAI